MKYDVLEGLKKHLEEDLNKNTAKRYYSAVVNLFRDKQFNSLSEVSPEYIQERMIQLKNKNNFSATKNGLLRLSELDQSLELPDQDFFSSVKKRNTRRKKGETICLDTVQRKVNQIKNKKLKLAYRLAMKSGARVSELASLKKEDIFMEDGKMKIFIKNGKGGKNGMVECMEDDYLYSQIQAYLEDKNPEDKLFYSSVYMREKASDLGLETHDFRRIFAITSKQKLMEEDGLKSYEANGIVKEKLRHSRVATTKRYLYRKKMIKK